MVWDHGRWIGVGLFLAAVFLGSPAFAQTVDPQSLIAEGERLVWLRAWTKAEPLFSQAERAFAASGDRRNALYAAINALRGRLPRLAVPEVSEQLEEYLEDPLVHADDRVRLRCLIIKGETDTDLDPALAEQSWREALALAEKLGEHAWANRARGELGLVAFLQGDVSAAVIQLGQALKVAQSNSDVSSVVRWMTLFGHGYVELGRPVEALEFYDRALKLAATVPELQFPLMTHEGKGDALARQGRFNDAEQVLRQALKVAANEGAWGYQAELTLRLALIAKQQKDTERAATLLSEATDFAHRAGGNRILAEVALERGRLLRAQNLRSEAVRVLDEGIAVARTMQERLLMPRLLAELAEVRVSQRRYNDAANLLEEGSDLLEGFLTKASSPWVQGRIINGARDLFLARMRLEGARGADAGRLFGIVEQARGRSLLELLLARPLADVAQPAAFRTQERRIAALQVQLFRTKTHAERQRLLDQIFVAEEQLAPLSTALFDQTRRTSPRKPVTLREFQRILHANELFLEFALAEPRSYALIVTRNTVRVQTLAGRSSVQRLVQSLLDQIRAGQDTTAEARALGVALLGSVKELQARPRIIVSPDAELHHVPFELLPGSTGPRLLETHVLSYVPSGSVLTVLREREAGPAPARTALAVSASPAGPAPPANTKSITRSIYDIDGNQLRPLPSANDEARAVASILGAGATVLLGDSATELAVKQQPLHEYRVIHFAVHGIPSSRYPARSALLVHPAGSEDGLLQAREILALRLRAGLVALSACDTSSGSLNEQEGVTSLVRPFLAAGAQSVVANLWAADDEFSLSLMREFYRQLGSGSDVADALRRAKLQMLERFGPAAVPKLWSGLLAYGDTATRIVDAPQRDGPVGGRVGAIPD